MKAGDYVRTKDNKIYKIVDIKFNETLLIDLYKTDISGYLMEFDIKKSSPNIIDLIEVGDYVNGRYVDKYQGKLGNFCELPNGKWEFIELSNEHYLISSIVTKEQFSSMEYKVESEVK